MAEGKIQLVWAFFTDKLKALSSTDLKNIEKEI